MCQSADISLVRRTIDAKYARARRAASLRWLLVNAALLAVLVYDLCVWCGAWCGALACAEALGALVLLANCAGHLARLATTSAPRPPVPATGGSPPAVRSDGEEEPGSLSPARSWRSSPPSPPATPPSPGEAGGGGRWPRADPDEFIADGRALAAYIRQAAERAGAGAGAGGGAGGTTRVLPAPPRAHQLALLPERGGAKEPAEEEGVSTGEGGAALWRRLQVDPDRLTEYNLNLRLWLHVTVVGRVARELTAGEAPPAALQPFLAPFADRQYVADRIKELSRGGCLSAYRWDGGGRGWRAGGGGGERPCDAELLLHLFATYVDAVAPAAGGGGAFTSRHLSAAPAPAPSPRSSAPVLRRTTRYPPHYVVVRGAETLSPGAGRNNLLHALLALLAAAARADPPALCRLHLGPAGLNMLWILGR